MDLKTIGYNHKSDECALATIAGALTCFTQIESTFYKDKYKLNQKLNGTVVVSRGSGGTLLYILRITYVFLPLKSLKLLNLIIPLKLSRAFCPKNSATINRIHIHPWRVLLLA